MRIPIYVEEEKDKYFTPLLESYPEPILADSTLRVLHKSSISAIYEEKWAAFLDLISSNPELLPMRSKVHENQTLLHIVAGQISSVPDVVTLKMISLCPKTVSYADDNGCLPLHYAASVKSQSGLVSRLLECWQKGTLIKLHALCELVHMKFAFF